MRTGILSAITKSHPKDGLPPKRQDQIVRKCNGGLISSDLSWRRDKRNLEMVMKFLNNSNSNSKRLFVPINEFEFNSFVVRVQRLSSRNSISAQNLSRMMRRPSRALWAASPIPGAA